jgi:enterochelin esterase-like enzyme
MVTSVPSPIATATPLTCLTGPGRVQEDVVATTKPPQKFIIYLPPCYEYFTERYPVLYLLHGQTYTEDQWLRLGAATTADKLIHNDVSAPFIMIFPDDHYWNAPAGAEFGNRLINDLIPYVDANYRTRADRDYRALGGLSRGGGWTAELGFDHPELFGALGLHSPALFKNNAPYLEGIIKNIPEEDRPKLWLDIGEADTELGNTLLFEGVLIQNEYIHEFHRFTGDHTERYWSAHIEQYLRWYVHIWLENSAEQ